MEPPPSSVASSFDSTTAIVVADLQNDFAHAKGSLYVREAESLVEPVNVLVREARRVGASRFYTQDWHPARTPHFVPYGGPWPVHCVAESWGAQFVEGFEVDGDVIRKGTGGEDGYSGFSMRDPLGACAIRKTPLELMLRSRGVRRVVVVGVATDYCVKETGLDALRLGFDVTVPRRLVRAVDLVQGDGERALAELQKAGAQLGE